MALNQANILNTAKKTSLHSIGHIINIGDIEKDPKERQNREKLI